MIADGGDEMVLREKRDDLSDVLVVLSSMPDDFMEDERNDPPPQERDFD